MKYVDYEIANFVCNWEGSYELHMYLRHKNLLNDLCQWKKAPCEKKYVCFACNEQYFLMFSTKSEVILAMQQEQLKAWEDSHKMNTFEVLFEYLLCSALKCWMW